MHKICFCIIFIHYLVKYFNLKIGSYRCIVYILHTLLLESLNK